MVVITLVNRRVKRKEKKTFSRPTTAYVGRDFGTNLKGKKNPITKTNFTFQIECIFLK